MARTAEQRLAALPRDRLLCEVSLWSADLIRLADDLARIAPYADVLHVDVADGHFAPAFLFFPDLVAQVRKVIDLPIHVHLMVDDAVLLSQVRQFAEAGADLISVHAENANAGQALDLLDELGTPSGLVLRVETPVDALAPWLGRVRFATLLGTAIGVKGQGLAPEAPGRIERLAALVAAAGRRGDVTIAADGGIRETTVPVLRAAGAQTVVMGSLAFGAPDLAARFAWARGLAGPAGASQP